MATIIGVIILVFILLIVLLWWIIPVLLFENRLTSSFGNKLLNQRLVLEHKDFFTRADLSYENHNQESRGTSLAYLENLEAIRKLLPLPSFMLKPLLNLKTGYEQPKEPLPIDTTKIVIYMHGAGGLAEENTLLHQMLIHSGYTIIRLSYTIDYEKNGLVQPKVIADMPAFLEQLNNVVAPKVTMELDDVLADIQKEFGLSLEDKKVILIAHSLGAGIILNYAVNHPELHVHKFINLDGTLLSPALELGLAVPQLHLSQSQQFDASWLKESNMNSPGQALGKDYGMRIQALLENSDSEYRWIQIAAATHFTFTDFPFILKPYKWVRKLAGSRAASNRIKSYVLAFVDGDLSTITIQNEDKEIRI